MTSSSALQAEGCADAAVHGQRNGGLDGLHGDQRRSNLRRNSDPLGQSAIEPNSKRLQ